MVVYDVLSHYNSGPLKDVLVSATLVLVNFCVLHNIKILIHDSIVMDKNLDQLFCSCNHDDAYFKTTNSKVFNSFLAKSNLTLHLIYALKLFQY